VSGRKNWRERFASIDFTKDKWVWFHSSSLGEFNDGKCIIEAYKKKYPHIKILLTFFSSSGYEYEKNYPYVDMVCYMPMDTKSNAAFFLDTLKPAAAFFIRNDVWPNYVLECAARNIPVFLVSFVLNANSTFLKFPLRNFYRNVFRKYNAIFVHEAVSKKLLDENHFNDRVIVSGNSRIDWVIGIQQAPFHDAGIEKFIAGNFCCISGSTLAKEREIFLEVFAKNQSADIKWIIVPHDIDQQEIKNAKETFKDKMICLSEIQNLNSGHSLLWIDSVGILAKVYRYTDIAFIGGGFIESGIHSILEPAVYGCQVCFGPCYRDYKSANDMLAYGGAKVVNNAEELQAYIMTYKNDKALLEKRKSENINYISQSAGATQMMLDYLAANYNIN